MYKLKFAINSQGDKNLSSVTVNGAINTLDLVQDDFHAYDKNQIVVGIIIVIAASIVGVILKIKK